MLTGGVISEFFCRRLGGGKLFYLTIPRDISKILFVCSLQNGICNNLIVNCKHGIWKKNLLFRFITGDECSQVGSCIQNYPGTAFNELETETYSVGAMGTKPPPLDQWNLLISVGFQAPMDADCWAPPPWKEKIVSPPPLDKFLNTYKSLITG